MTGVQTCALPILSIFRHDLIRKAERKSVYALIGMQMVFTFATPMISIPGHVGGLISGFLLSFLLISRKIPVIEVPYMKKTYDEVIESYDEDKYY